jgi:tripartite-type tricarboxylate transporter receptor subunit TctC
MRKAMLRRAFLRLAAASFFFPASKLSAQSYPSGSIDIVIAFPPGGPADTAPRIAIEYLRPLLNNANLVPVNKPGAGGGIAAEYVARSKPDGHTILATGNSTLSVKTAIDKNTPYKIEDLAPLGMYAVDVGILAAQPALGIKTIEELIEHARKNPDRLSFASAGQGTTTHISAELLKHAVGIKMLHVPFRGSGPAAQAMLGGHVPLISGAYSSLRPLLENGTVIPLITTAPRRLPALADVPTLAEKGYERAALNIWNALYVPAATPQPIFEQLAGALAQASRNEAMNAAIVRAGMQPDYGDAARARRLLRQEYEVVAKLAAVVDLGG